MGKTKEPLDSLSGRIATGIHLVAVATVIAPSSTREELDLAEKILKRDPPRSAPRENESPVEGFNRLLDVAIDSANQSAGCGTRAERRALLCADLERAGIVLIDCCVLAEFVGAKLDLDAIKLAAEKPEPEPAPLLKLLSDEDAAELVDRINGTPNLHPLTGSSATAFATVPYSALAGVTSAEDLGAELYSSELANSGSIDVDPVVND
jgi:hypothetical protein